MRTINARNVNEALYIGAITFRDIIDSAKETFNSRVGEVYEVDGPVCTEYFYPQERCVFIRQRDWNPFFALFEALWIMAGRDDVKFLYRFNAGMAQFSDNGKDFHAPYGHRLRKAYGFDQLRLVVSELHQHPNSRRAVAAIWHPNKDLNAASLDLPCNDLIMFKVRDNHLNMTVCCRSNDMLLGAYNVNHFQFSYIQEWVAGHLGVEIGSYHQLSDNFHVYTQNPHFKNVVLDNSWGPDSPYDGYGDCPIPMVNMFEGCTPDEWDGDLAAFFSAYDHDENPKRIKYVTPYFNNIVVPMYAAHHAHKFNKDTHQALCILAERMPYCDLRLAATVWLENRL